MFNGSAESFSILKQFHCVAVVIYEVVVLSTGNSIENTYLMPVLLLFVIPAIAGLMKLEKHTEERTSLIPSINE